MKKNNTNLKFKKIIGPMLGLTTLLCATAPLIVSCSNTEEAVVEKWTGNEFEIVLSPEGTPKPIKEEFYSMEQDKDQFVTLRIKNAGFNNLKNYFTISNWWLSKSPSEKDAKLQFTPKFKYSKYDAATDSLVPGEYQDFAQLKNNKPSLFEKILELIDLDISVDIADYGRENDKNLGKDVTTIPLYKDITLKDYINTQVISSNNIKTVIQEVILGKAEYFQNKDGGLLSDNPAWLAMLNPNESGKTSIRELRTNISSISTPKNLNFSFSVNPENKIKFEGTKYKIDLKFDENGVQKTSYKAAIPIEKVLKI